MSVAMIDILSRPGPSKTLLQAGETSSFRAFRFTDFASFSGRGRRETKCLHQIAVGASRIFREAFLCPDDSSPRSIPIRKMKGSLNGVSRPSPERLDRYLALRDLTDPDQGRHAINILTTSLSLAIEQWSALPADVIRRPPVVLITDNSMRLPRTRRDRALGTFSHYIDEKRMLRTTRRRPFRHCWRKPRSIGSSFAPGSSIAAMWWIACTSANRTRSTSGSPGEPGFAARIF